MTRTEKVAKLAVAAMALAALFGTDAMADGHGSGQKRASGRKASQSAGRPTGGRLDLGKDFKGLSGLSKEEIAKQLPKPGDLKIKGPDGKELAAAPAPTKESVGEFLAGIKCDTGNKDADAFCEKSKATLKKHQEAIDNGDLDAAVAGLVEAFGEPTERGRPGASGNGAGQ